MDSTPPSHRSEPRSRLKSASRLARIGDFNVEREESPHLSLEQLLRFVELEQCPLHQLPFTVLFCSLHPTRYIHPYIYIYIYMYVCMYVYAYVYIELYMDLLFKFQKQSGSCV